MYKSIFWLGFFAMFFPKKILSQCAAASYQVFVGGQ